MSFAHKFPTSVMLIGYIENAKKLSPTKSSGMKVVAKLYNPSEKNRRYDLRIPIMALGKPGKLAMEFSKSGDLVSIVGQMVVASSQNGLNLCVLADHIKTLDEESDYDIPARNGFNG